MAWKRRRTRRAGRQGGKKDGLERGGKKGGLDRGGKKGGGRMEEGAAQGVQAYKRQCTRAKEGVGRDIVVLAFNLVHENLWKPFFFITFAL